ncbi:MAG: Gfo/Idh/MocA family oxidoreductase [Patescibacteria group bacterium]
MILGLIGVGTWGKNILATLEKIPNVEVKYLCAKNPESLVGFEKKYEKISDWRKLLDKPDLDGVCIATPPATHAEIAAAFVERGKAVLVEKPMVTNLEDALKLQAIVQKKSSLLMVGFEYLFNDHITYLKKEIEKGTFGKILEVTYEHYVSPSRSDVDIFWDVAPHPFSIFQYLFNPEKLTSSEGKIEREIVSVKIQFQNSPLLEINATSSGSTKTRKLVLLGENATATLDETVTENKLSIIKNGKILFPEIRASAPLQNELEHFIQCIQSGKTPLTDVDFGCKITEWLETISKNQK